LTTATLGSKVLLVSCDERVDHLITGLLDLQEDPIKAPTPLLIAWIRNIGGGAEVEAKGVDI
jgi:hypothetical protein